MTRRKTERSNARNFTWGVRSTELAIVQTLLATEPLAGTADCTGGCGEARLEALRKRRTAPRRPAR